MPEEERGIYIWGRDFATYGRFVLSINNWLQPYIAANPGPTFDVSPDALAARTPITGWALGDGDESVPVTPVAARVVAVERASREWFTESDVNMDISRYVHVASSGTSDASVTVVGRHLVWEADHCFVVIPEYASLLEEIVSSELDEEAQGALVTSRIFRFVVGPSFAGIRAIGRRLVCQMDGGAFLVDLDDIQGATVPVVQITKGFPYPAEYWRQADKTIATPTGLLEVVGIEAYLQKEYAQATEKFAGLQVSREDTSAGKCGVGKWRGSADFTFTGGIRVLSFEPHSKFVRQEAAKPAKDQGGWGHVKITF